VPREREGEFVTELFERYKRVSGNVEEEEEEEKEAILQMYLSGLSTRKIAGITEAFSKVKGSERTP
jgi:transposase-like protein